MSSDTSEAVGPEAKKPINSLVEFEMIDVPKRVCKILGCLSWQRREYTDPPAPHKMDEIVTLISGKYPLTDYRDISRYAQHVYIFRKGDGSTFEGILEGFTYDATYAGQHLELGGPTFTITMSAK